MTKQCTGSMIDKLRRADTRFEYPRFLAVARLRWPIQEIGKVLVFSEEWFARILGLIVLAFALRIFLPLRVFLHLPLEGVTHNFHSIADVVAALIFATWLVLKILRTTLLPNLESRVGCRIFDEAATCYSICGFSDLPTPLQDQCAESMAILAYNRWTFNASLDSRRRFFRTLGRKYPEGISVALMYYRNSSTVKCVGYTALVPLPIPS